MLRRHQIIEIWIRRVYLYYTDVLTLDTLIITVRWTDMISHLSLCIAYSPPNQRDTLLTAVDENNIPAIEFLLQNVDPEYVWPALSMCIDYRIEEVIQVLLKFIDITAERFQQFIPRALSDSSCIGILKLFIKAGCDPSIMLEMAVSRYPDHHPCVIQYLLSAGANVHYSMDSPLVIAIENNDVYTVSLLIKAGADVNARYNYPVHCSRIRKYYACLDLLIDAGAVSEYSSDKYSYISYIKSPERKRNRKRRH